MANKPLSADDWAVACRHLARKDRVLRRLIPEQAGDIPLFAQMSDPFVLLVRSVVWQQLSPASALSLWRRYCALPGAHTPHGVLALTDESLRSIRLPQRKMGYLRDLAALFANDIWAGQSWHSMSDAEVLDQLGKVRGVGRWNAEMFLIFHLARPDVLPIDDAALQAGISAHYFSGDPVSRSDIREVAQAWKPWSSVGAWWIWQSCNAMPMAMHMD